MRNGRNKSKGNMSGPHGILMEVILIVDCGINRLLDIYFLPNKRHNIVFIQSRYLKDYSIITTFPPDSLLRSGRGRLRSRLYIAPPCQPAKIIHDKIFLAQSPRNRIESLHFQKMLCSIHLFHLIHEVYILSYQFIFIVISLHCNHHNYKYLFISSLKCLTRHIMGWEHEDMHQKYLGSIRYIRLTAARIEDVDNQISRLVPQID